MDAKNKGEKVVCISEMNITNTLKWTISSIHGKDRLQEAFDPSMAKVIKGNALCGCVIKSAI